jgi:flagellar basal-body rod modification protein FlgD
MAVSGYASYPVAQNASGDAAALGGETLSQSVKKTMGKEDFLKLLVTQLRFQDPMSPDDPKEFLAQLAQFSSLEQQINVNQNLESVNQLVSSLKDALGMSRAVTLLGKTVKGLGNSLSLSGGQVNAASYQLPREAKEVTVTIYDGAGRLVRTLNLGSQAAGLRQFSWDGKDAEGKALSDGSYTYQVTALDRQGKGIEVTNYFTGKVQEVFQDRQGVWLKIDGRDIPLDSIVSVSEPS